MKWLYRSGLALLIVVLLVAAAMAWIVGTNAGARWVVSRAAAIETTLSITAVEGTIAGALTVRGLRYGDERSGLEVQAERVFVDLAFADILRGRVHVGTAAIEGLLVTLREQEGEPEPPPSEPFNLKPPIDIVIDDFTVERGTIRSNGESLIDIETLQLAASWTDAGIAIGKLDVTAEQGMAKLQGNVGRDEVYTGQVRGEFQWRTDTTRIAGSLQAETTQGVLQGTLQLASPTVAKLVFSLGQQQEMPWSMELDVPAFDPRKLSPDSSAQSLAASLQGSGTQAGGSLSGRVMLNDEPLQVRQLQFSRAAERIDVQATVLVAKSEGELRAKGAILLAQEPWRADLDVQWDELHLPAVWVGQQLDTHGQLQLSGNVESFTAQGAVSLGPPDYMADIRLDIQGSQQRIDVNQLQVQQSRGHLAVTGQLQLQPEVQWELTATAAKFNPGAFLAAWPGELNFNLQTQGKLTEAGPEASLQLSDLRGNMRNRPLSGAADLTLTSQPIVAGTLNLQSGDSRIELRGDKGNAWNAIADFQIASLGDWVPDSSGQLNGRFSVKGEWPALQIEGEAQARRVEAAGVHVDSASLRADVANPRELNGSARLEFTGARAASFAIESGELQLSGSLEQHTLTLEMTGDPASMQLRVQGASTQVGDHQRWSESIQNLVLDLRDVGRLELVEPATVTLEESAVTVSQACFAHADARLCASGGMSPTGEFDVRYLIEDLPLQLIAAMAPTLPVDVSGLIAGEGDVRRDASGQLFGKVGLRSREGRLAQPVVGESTEVETTALLSYQDLRLDAQLNGTEAQASLGARLDERGSLSGEVSLSQLGTTEESINGSVTARIPDIAALTLLTSQVANTHGSVQLQADVSGTMATPVIATQLHVADLALDVPALGLKLRNGIIDVAPRNSEEMALSGSIQSGDGRLTFEGSAAYSGAVQLSIAGQQFLAADIPGVRVIAAPDLKFSRNAERMDLSGEVRIPSATVDVQKLPRGVRAKTGSPDVVVVDAQTQEEAAAEKMPLYASIDIILGEDVKLSGFGLQAQLDGRLAVREAPGAPTSGSGEIRVAGTYKAYGQDLTIRQGSILYAGTPLDNPTLRITAVREIDDVTAGLRIAGTARSPELSVFSDPSMDDASALSYLVAGRPLEEIGEGDGDALQSAAQSLGTAAGGLLSKRLGSRLGVDTVGIEESEMLGGSAFTVGQYLSPRLYLSYGVGLFEPGDVITLRYRLSDEVSVKAERGPDDNRAGIEYRVEK